MNVDDYALQTTRVSRRVKGERVICFRWRANIHGMPFECAREYTSERGAMKAGERWLKKYVDGR